RRERIKRRVEYCGVALLAVYTLYTIKMYSANKEAADAAKSAAETASRQLLDYETATSARLIFEEFNPTLTMGKPGQGMLINGSFKITNVGGSIAREIYIAQSIWGSMRSPDPDPEFEPIPAPNGPSLAIQKSLEIPVGTQVGQWERVEHGQWFTG